MGRGDRTGPLLIGAALAACALWCAAGDSRAAEEGPLAVRKWTSRIDYFNPGTAAATFTVRYRPTAGAAATSDAVAVAPKASGSLLVGATVAAGFSGAGVVSSDQPLATLYRQQATGAAPTAPMLAAAFGRDEAGTGRFYLPEVRRGASGNTLIGVQNLADGDARVSLELLSATGALKKSVTAAPVKAGASVVVDLAKIAALGANFDGSAVVRSWLAAGGAPAPVAASAELIPPAGKTAYAFPGAKGAPRQLLPRATCTTAGAQTLGSVFQVQNAGPAPARAVVSYYYPLTASGKTAVKRVRVTSTMLAPGKRLTVNPCSLAALRGRGGVVATIEGRNAAGKPASLAVLSRLVNSATGTQNAYAAPRLPVAGPDGAYRIVFPSVEWGPTGPRTKIEVMNAAPRALAAATAIPVTVSYYSAAGTLVKTRTLKLFTAAATDPSSAGALVAGRFKGAVVVESATPVVAAAQVQQVGYTAADGYAGLPW